MEYHWNSRAHRKGRWPVAKPSSSGAPEKQEWTHQRARLRFWGWDIGDISWWVAMLFLLGSIFWCANGVLAFCFYTNSTPHVLLSEAATAFIGGTLFWIGGYLSYVESLNPAAHAHFGWEVDREAKRLVEPRSSSSAAVSGRALGRGRRHFGKHIATAAAGGRGGGRSLGVVDAENGKTDVDNEGQGKLPPKWKWEGADWSSFGFVANVIQLYGASIFWVSVLCGMPGILPDAGSAASEGLPAKNVGLWEGLFWVPQVLGSPGFIISGAMFSLEVQKKWYKPEFLSLGWHVGFWNLIGGFGFLFCGIFGLFREFHDDWAQKWGTAFSTFWGSWAFLLASYLQFFETLNKR